jgi:hypothetical protein
MLETSRKTYGITVPEHIAKQYQNTYFKCTELGQGKIILESGAVR